MKKPFRYKRIPSSDKLPSVKAVGVEEPDMEYSGFINGLKAAKGEENLLKAAIKYYAISGFRFRVSVGAPRNMPGWKELDFLFIDRVGQYVAIQVKDMTFVHHGQESEQKDKGVDAMMVREFEKDGIRLKGNRIYTIDALDLETVEEARQALEDIL